MIGNFLGRERMIDPFTTITVNIENGAERPRIPYTLGTLVYQGAELSAYGAAIDI